MNQVNKRRAAPYGLSAIAIAALTALPAASAAGETASGRALYQAACASCHGNDGRGVERSVVGFDTPLPDFTDCSFASREPDGDWAGVAQRGGPLRGFDERMPAFGDAVTMEETWKILEHIRSFCVDESWPRGELNLPRPLVTEKAYPEDEVVWTTGVTEEADAVSSSLVYEKRFGARNQVEVKLPLDFHELEANDWTGGIGDVALAVKRALFHGLGSGSIFSVTGEVILPTGNEDKGLGKGMTVFEPFVTFGQILPADSFLQAQVGVEIPTDSDKAENEAFWRFAFGKTFTQGEFGRAWSPMVEVLAVRELADGEEILWDLVPQVQVTLNTRQHVMLNAGVRLPINEKEGRSTTLLFYLLWDWFDGGFFEGW